MDGEMCLVDSCTTHTILREVKFFQTLTKREGQVLTIARRDVRLLVLVGPLSYFQWVHKYKSRMHYCILIH